MVMAFVYLKFEREKENLIKENMWRRWTGNDVVSVCRGNTQGLIKSSSCKRSWAREGNLRLYRGRESKVLQKCV